MISRISLIVTLAAVLVLAGCGPSQQETAALATQAALQTAAAIPTAAPSRTPTAVPSATQTPTQTPKPTLTPMPTSTATPTAVPPLAYVPISDLVNSYKTKDGSFEFQYPKGWKAFENSGLTYVMPEEYAEKFNSASAPQNVGATIALYRIDLLGDLFTDIGAIQKPQDVFALVPKSDEYTAALNSNPEEPPGSEINGYPAYEIITRGSDGNRYEIIILAREAGVAVRMFGFTKEKDWSKMLPVFAGIARSITLGDIPPIVQTDASLDGLVLPAGPDDFAEEPYIDALNGIQLQYPQGWGMPESPDLLMLTQISLDMEHSLCYFTLGLDSDQCGSPVVVGIIASPEISTELLMVSFDKSSDREQIWQIFDALATLTGLASWNFDPIEQFEINGYEGIGVKFTGSTWGFGEPSKKENPMTGYILAVKDGRRAALMIAMAPTKFWGPFRSLFAAMLKSFRFFDGPLAPTATITPTPTLIPAPPQETPTARRFTFNGVAMRIEQAVLAEECHEAYEKIHSESVDTFAVDPFAQIPWGDQPSGKYCLLIMVSTVPGIDVEYTKGVDTFGLLARAIISDEMLEIGNPLFNSINSKYQKTWVDMFAYPDPSATTFTLTLPDGQVIPIPLASQPAPKLPTASPLPTFTPQVRPPSSGTPPPLAASEIFTDEHGVAMAFIPAGDFQMGRDEEVSKAECNKFNGTKKPNNCDFTWWFAPEHTVTLDAFYMDIEEVSNARYAECVAAGVCKPPAKTSSATRSSYYGSPKYADYPVIFVDWQMARTYCQWRNADLPTEAQWEKAARGTDQRWFPWGDVLDGTRSNFCDANCQNDSSRKDLNDGYEDTAPVNAYPKGASPFRLLNLAGNVAEWVLDEFSATFYEKSPRTNPVGKNLTGSRVTRGGGFNDYDLLFQWVSSRYGMDPNAAWPNLGFRCARKP